MTVTYIGNGIYRGLSSDTKPTTGINANAIFMETDTKQVFFWFSTAWTNKKLITAHAQSGVAELVASWKVADATSSVEILNASNTDAIFSPWLRATNLDNTGPGLYFYAYVGNALDTGSEAGMRLDARKADNTALVTRPLFSFRSAGTEVLRINTKGDVLQTVIATTSTGETLHEWRPNDVNSYIRFINASPTDARFLPQITGRQVEDATMQALTTQARIEAAHDTGTIPVTSFDSRRQGDAAITTRPLFDFRNNGTSVFTITPSGFNLTSRFLDVGEIAAPASPAVNTGRLFFDSADEKIKIKKSGGTVVDLETGGGGGASTLDDLTDVDLVTDPPNTSDVLTYDGTEWIATAPPGAGGGESNTASNVGTAGVGVWKDKVGTDLRFKKINGGSTKITVTDDTGSNEVDLDIAEANLTLSSIGGSVTKAQTPATTVHSDQTNTFGAFDQIFPHQRLQIGDSDASHVYLIAGSNLAANRTITLPLLAGNDTAVTEAFAQTLTNKTINASSNTLSNVGDAAIAAHTTTKITTTNKSLLNSALVYNDQNNALGAFYQDLAQIAAPADPASGTRRLFTDSATGELSVRTSAGATRTLEGGVSASSTDTFTNKTIVAANNTISGIVDANIGSHTSTKISITDKVQLPSAAAYEDEINTFTFAQRFSSYIDVDKITIPADPGANIGRFYVKQIDVDNDGVFVKLKKGGAITEVQIL